MKLASKLSTKPKCGMKDFACSTDTLSANIIPLLMIGPVCFMTENTAEDDQEINEEEEDIHRGFAHLYTYVILSVPWVVWFLLVVVIVFFLNMVL